MNTKEELREAILLEFKQVQKLAPADYTENCTNVVMSLVENYVVSRESALLSRAKQGIEKYAPPKDSPFHHEFCNVCGINPDVLVAGILIELDQLSKEIE